MRLDPADLEALADLVATKLREQSPIGDTRPFLTADEVAKRLGLSRSVVYARADELGAVRVGRAVRFPADVRPHERDASTTVDRPTPKAKARPARVPLLPIRGAS